MLVFLLIAAFLGVLILIVVRRRQLELLWTVACMIGAVLILILMQDSGLLPGSDGPLRHLRPQSPLDAPLAAPSEPPATKPSEAPPR
ncbi:hypothetical protein MMB17_12940 [Methylobacterium organophilum]|uniref:hypothetical protein n=1 Tax=Methylobacterium organophilum TaxID=410 RepID=UPI001F12F00B|nr:hypothetical protein [Methylobacterium organophilum]UMY15658.1 hypothetical protein MMB17_12940 [Methylobacterium organophilum]